MAEHLNKFVYEVEALPLSELKGWMAYFEYKDLRSLQEEQAQKAEANTKRVLQNKGV